MRRTGAIYVFTAGRGSAERLPVLPADDYTSRTDAGEARSRAPLTAKALDRRLRGAMCPRPTLLEKRRPLLQAVPCAGLTLHHVGIVTRATAASSATAPAAHAGQDSHEIVKKHCAKEGALEEQTQRYRKIRSVLEHLVTDMPGELDRPRPGAALQAARTYLHDHCAECGATLEGQDHVLVQALEMVRIGASTASDVTDMPICPDCYASLRTRRQQFAPLDEIE